MVSREINIFMFTDLRSKIFYEKILEINGITLGCWKKCSLLQKQAKLGIRIK